MTFASTAVPAFKAPTPITLFRQPSAICPRPRSAHPAVSSSPSTPRHLSYISACAVGESPPPAPMPQLYDAWFPPSNEIAVQMRAAVTAALADGVYQMELKWPCVPNLEEKDFGTKNNYEFGKHVSRVLGMDGQSEYPLIKRYLGQFCDLYWVLEVAKLFPEHTVWAVFTDGISKEPAAGALGNVRLASMKKEGLPAVEEGDVVCVVDPRPTDVWVRGAKLQASPTSPLIFLNSQFNETYGLVGPRKGILKSVETVYFLKRITRGYAFRSYPGPWQAVLELPDCSCEGMWTLHRFLVRTLYLLCSFF